MPSFDLPEQPDLLWFINHPEAYVEATGGRVLPEYVLSVWEQHSRSGRISDAQVGVLRRIIADAGLRLETEAGHPEDRPIYRLVRSAFLPPLSSAAPSAALGAASMPSVRNDSPATADDVPTIFNGTYTINDGSEHITYRIHTVTRGALQGQRIIKRQTQYGEYEGFAFLTADGRFRLWRRFEPSRDQQFVVWGERLIDILRENSVWHDPDRLLVAIFDDNTHVPVYENEATPATAYRRWEIQRGRSCRRCNRALTTPESIDRGIGPECEQRITADRTTAASHSAINVNGNTATVSTEDTSFGAATAARAAARRRPVQRRTSARIVNTPAAQMSQIDPTWEQ